MQRPRHYDPTPWSVRFGGLQETLVPHGRYALRGDDDNYHLVPLKEYRKVFPKTRPPCPLDSLGSPIPGRAWLAPGSCLPGSGSRLTRPLIERVGLARVSCGCAKLFLFEFPGSVG